MSLKKSENETITDYFLRAERNAVALRNAGEVISDGLLVAMSLKGLPVDYSAFSSVIMQRQDEVTFSEFKTALKSFEETVRAKSDEKSEKVMRVKQKQLFASSVGDLDISSMSVVRKISIQRALIKQSGVILIFVRTRVTTQKGAGKIKIIIQLKM